MQTIKALSFILAAPLLILLCFQSNQIKTKEVSRAPAVEMKVKKELTSVKSAVKQYLLAVNNIK